MILVMGFMFFNSANNFEIDLQVSTGKTKSWCYIYAT